MEFELSSPAFGQGQGIPKRFSCEGENLSPALAWNDPPPGAQGFALVMDDPDAPAGTWIHWLLYELPADLRGLPQGLPKTERLDLGAKQGAVWGVERFERLGYQGPCPPPGRAHRYVFTLYALKQGLSLPPRQNVFQLRQAMRGQVLAEAALIGTYRR